MNTLLQNLTENFKAAFKKCGYDEKYGKVTLSNRPDLCEYQCNGAMAAAKEYKKAPIMIANDVVAKLEKSKCFKNFSIEVKAVIIGSTIESDSYYEFITSICPSLELYTYNYRISGLTFEKVTLNEKECTFGSMDEIFSSFGRNDLRDICGYMFPDFPF